VKNFRLVGFTVALGVVIACWALTCAAWRFDEVAAGVVPLEPRDFPSLTLLTLGTGGAYENRARLGPATAVALGKRVVLIDAGRGVAESLRAAKLPVGQPDTLLLTHLLPENTVGIDDLLLTGWLEGRAAPLRVIGPPGTRALVDGLAAAHTGAVAALGSALALPPEGASATVLEVEDGWSETLGALPVRAAALPGGPLDARAYRFEAGGRSIVVSGTGWAPEALAGFARSASVLVHEAAFIPTPEVARELGIEAETERLQRESALHTALADVGGLAARAGVGTLVLVRLRPPPVYDLQITSLVDDSFDGRILIASDGDEITP
jgi:ribonuclease BN (tRNA processing enzyme)